MSRSRCKINLNAVLEEQDSQPFTTEKMGNRLWRARPVEAAPALENEPLSSKPIKVVVLRACPVNVERMYLNIVADPVLSKPGFAVIHRRRSTVHVWVVPHVCANQVSDYVTQIMHRAHGIMILCDEKQDIQEVVDQWQYHAFSAPRHVIEFSPKLRLQQVSKAFDGLFRLLEAASVALEPAYTATSKDAPDELQSKPTSFQS
jgi:hypothetical protein